MKQSGQNNDIKSSNAHKFEEHPHFILDHENEINKRIGDLIVLEPTLSGNREIEVEVELTRNSSEKSINSFVRGLSYFKSKFPNVTSDIFSEVKYTVTSEQFNRQQYIAHHITRNFIDKGVIISYTKFKKRKDTIIPLDTIHKVSPIITVSIESPDFKFVIPKSANFSSSRERWTFPLTYGGAIGSIQFTKDRSDKDLSKTYHSVEIELDSSTITDKITRSHMDFLDHYMRIMTTIINRSGILMTDLERNTISSDFLRALDKYTASGKIAYKISSGVLNKPRDLESRDLSFLNPSDSDLFMQITNLDRPQDIDDVFRDNNVHIPLMSIPGGYNISLKADGVRYALYFHTYGIYLIDPFNENVTKLSGYGTEYENSYGVIPETIFDCEVISELDQTGKSNNIEILCFDLLAYKGENTRGFTDNLTKIRDKRMVKSLGESNRRYKSYVYRVQTMINAINEFKQAKEIGGQKINPNDVDSGDIRAKRYPKYDFIKIEAKPTVKLPSLDDYNENIPHEIGINFFNIMADFIEQFEKEQNTNGIKWKTDGLILTPSHRQYKESEDVFNQGGSNISLIRKWKKIITTDFIVRRIGKLTIMSLKEDRQNATKKSESVVEMVEFKGNLNFPWNGNVLLNNDMEEKIYEFEWMYVEEIQDYAFIPIRERPDKGVPNTVTVANRNWNLINRPITRNDLIGHNLNRMRWYHNKVKRFLLDELAEKTEKKILLDIGSGRGGDILKWKSFNRVYAVEPDMKNYKEFITRLERRGNIDNEIIAKGDTTSLNHYKRAKFLHERTREVDENNSRMKIDPINALGEDVEYLKTVIPQNTIECVTMFNVMTFFYQNLEKLNSIITTVKTFLKRGGYFYVILFDGELMLNSMQGHNTIQTETIKVSKSEDESCRKIYIEISDGSIVRGQFEYLIQPKEFIEIMDNHGFRLIDDRYLNEEPMLSPEEYWFSSMSKVLKFSYSSNPSKTDFMKFSNELIKRIMKQRVLVPIDSDDAPVVVNSKSLKDFRLLRLGSISDGSSYLHSTLRAFSSDYKQLPIPDRYGYIIQLRKELAENYTMQLHNSVGNGYYSDKTSTNYSYDNIRRSISNVGFWIDNKLLEYIGDQLGVNVFLITGIDATVLSKEYELRIKPGRPNIVLYWLNDNYYETVGELQSDNKTIKTVFENDHPLIKRLSA